jgi:hypothetical protein
MLMLDVFSVRVLVEATLCVMQCGLGKLGFELGGGYLRKAPRLAHRFAVDAAANRIARRIPLERIFLAERLEGGEAEPRIQDPANRRVALRRSGHWKGQSKFGCLQDVLLC